MDLLKIKHHEGEEQQVKIKGIIQEGYLRRTPQGRTLTEKGWTVSGMTPTGEAGQMDLI